MECLNFWREMYKSAAPDERPFVATLGRLIANKEVSNADVDALKKFTAVNCANVTPGVIDLMARRFIQKICPPNCYDDFGIFTGGKRYRYVDIRRLTSLPVAIKIADMDFFNRCHACVFHVLSRHLMHVTGLTIFSDVLKLGFDTATNEFVAPLNRRQYTVIGLNWGGYNTGYGFDDRRQAFSVLSHLNIKATNANMPYVDNRFIGLSGEIVFAGCTGHCYRKINLPFPPTEKIKILQPYKI